MLERFGVSMDQRLLKRFDRLIEQRGYRTRSEAIRDLVREQLVREQWTQPNAEVVGAITLVYDHQAEDLPHKLAEHQHRPGDLVVCTTHVHLGRRDCLEVVLVRGPAKRVQRLADKLISTKGVKHGKLVATGSGDAL